MCLKSGMRRRGLNGGQVNQVSPFRAFGLYPTAEWSYRRVFSEGYNVLIIRISERSLGTI